jgi:hypothetical protein
MKYYFVLTKQQTDKESAVDLESSNWWKSYEIY